MDKYKFLKVGGAILDSVKLEEYLEKFAADQTLTQKSSKKTYPIPRLKENIKYIENVYNILNEDIKNKIPIHPAGEWILDNFYILEKSAKVITRNLTLKKYINLVGVDSFGYKGFARAYVLAREIVSYTDGNIDEENLEKYLIAYQNKKSLNMDELWEISTFLQINIIEKVRAIAEKIYISQMQKRKVENIVAKYLEGDPQNFIKIPIKYNFDSYALFESKYAFIEYMSYKLKQYGKKAYSYLEILEEQVKKNGSTISECINKEHFDIATKKISLANSIISINELNRIDFTEIFNRINGVEEVFKMDPSKVYEGMDYKTKELYRSWVEKISKKTKISEVYIAKKCLELAKKNCLNNGINSKKSHIGYYLISDGKWDLYESLLGKKIKKKSVDNKSKKYIYFVTIFSVLVSSAICFWLNINNVNMWTLLVVFLFLINPIKNITIKIVQYISGKITPPTVIPKLDFYKGIPIECASMVVIPTIIGSKEKVKEIFDKLEIYYNANKSENLFFTLLGDCTASCREDEDFDEDVIKFAFEKCTSLNQKYMDMAYPKFNFVYRKRTWSSTENCYLGWERKRGLLNQFNNYILGNILDPFKANSFEKNNKELPKINYVITLDSDTDLVLNSGLEMVGAMAHILNKPCLNRTGTRVIDGYAIMQPRVGIRFE